MKKILFLLAGLMLVLASCSDGGSDTPGNPIPQPTPTPEETASITIDSNVTSNGVAFDAKGGEKSVSFSANNDWTLSVATPANGTVWCTPSATSGAKGDATVKFIVKENADYDDRSVSVTIKAGIASKTFTITQKSAEALLVTSTKFEVPQEGGAIEVEVKANINYELQIAENTKSWISETKSRALTTKKHSFTIAASEEYEKREGEIHIKSGDKLEIVKVYQAGGAILMLSKNDYSVSSEGETISVDIKSNFEYGVQMPNVDWITDAPAFRAASSHTLKYVVLPNETPDTRSAEIIFYDKNSSLKDTLKVVQAKKDAIVEAVDLGLSIKWANCNLGAVDPQDYGDYYCYGELTPKTVYTWDNWDCPETLKLSSNRDAATHQLGSDWRMPTKVEATELLTECSWALLKIGNSMGYQITGKTGNSIFLPLTGSASSTEGYNYEARYRTSDAYLESSIDGIRDPATVVLELQLDFADTEIDSSAGWSGHPIRPVYCGSK